MNSKKIRLKTAKIVLLTLVLVLVITGAVLFFLKGSSKVKVGEHNEIKTEKYFLSKIAYPITKNKTVDAMIATSIQNTKKEFYQKAKKDKPKEPYELTISYVEFKYKDIRFIEFTEYSYTGGNHYKREERSYYFNEKTQEMMQFKDFFLEGKDYLNEISNLSKEKVLQYASLKGKTFDEAWVGRGTDASEENFKHFYLHDKGLTIIFPPYKVSSWADGEVRITIPFGEINRYLKEEYRGKVEDGNERPNVTRPKIDLGYTKGKKLLAITFDDGPSQNTKHLLDELQKKNARVTFFVLGNRVSSYVDTIRREYEEGHLVASHTYSHLNLLKLPDAALEREITGSSDAIKNVLGEAPIYIRPPYGSINDRIKSQSSMYTILWNIDTQDWKNRNSDMVYQTIVNNAKDGSVVLLHDLYASSVDGALRAIDTLKEQGYAFVTIEEMRTLKGLSLDKMKSYTSFGNK